MAAGNLHIDLGDQYRIFSTPGRLSGVLCLRCQEAEKPGAFFPTDSLTMMLRFLHAHELRRHGGERLTPEARSAAPTLPAGARP